MVGGVEAMKRVTICLCNPCPFLVMPILARVEGNVDTRKQDCSKALLELDVALGFLLGFRTLEALNDNVTQHFLCLLSAVSFHQLQKVSVLITGQSITVQYTLVMSIFCTLR